MKKTSARTQIREAFHIALKDNLDYLVHLITDQKRTAEAVNIIE